MNKPLLPLLVFLLCAQGAVAEDSARAQLQHFTSGLNSLEASFDQEIVDVDGRPVETSSGQLVLMQPAMFRWEYSGEYPQQIVADGERVWIYDIELEQVSVKAQSSATADSPLSVLTQPETLDEQFQVTELGIAEGEALLELVPLDSQSEFDRIILGFYENQLRSMILEDAFGQRTHIVYHELVLNTEIAPGTFELNIPEGVDIIGDLPEE
jgi:outer membrane lipoprotein carrier protein